MTKLIFSNRRNLWLWLIAIAFFVTQQAAAIGLGEIQVDSYLGEALQAQVELSEWTHELEDSLKVRLASAEEYKKNGYAYPYHIKYSFLLVNESGKSPLIRITSSQAIQDPYLHVLLELSSARGKVVKVFTILIDPPPEQRPQATRPTSPAVAEAVSSVASAITAGRTAATRHEHPRPAKSIPPDSVRQRAERQKTYADSKVSNQLSLSLSTALTISHDDPGVANKNSSDALQEELIAKEKTLQELQQQIGEMQTVIQGLQMRLSLSAAVPAVSAVSAAVSQVLPVVAPVSLPPPVTPLATDKVYWKWLAALLAGGTLLAAIYYWWRKRNVAHDWSPSDFVASAESPVIAGFDPTLVTDTVAQPAAAAVSNTATRMRAVGELSMKVPAYKEPKPPSQLPAEYDLLEEAHIYLRFGHDKLAEEVLRDALKINPKNMEVYLALLGILEARGDAPNFQLIALELQDLADEMTWQSVAAMGRTLDMGNPLYD